MAEQGSGLLTVLSWNVNGLGTRSPEVQALLEDRNIDIMCLTETKANSTHQYDSRFPDFAVIGKSVNKLAESTQRPFPGGLLFAHRKSLPYRFSKILNKSHFILWVKADPKKPESNVQMVFAVIYNPPTDKTTKDEILSIMEREYKILVDEHKMAKFYLTGDFNAYTYGQLDGPEGSNLKARKFGAREITPDGQTRDFGKTLLDFCKRTGFRIANGRFGDESQGLTTRRHILDYLLCRKKDWSFLINFKVDDFGTTNHNTLIFTLKTNIRERTCKVRFTLSTKQRSEQDFEVIWYLQTLHELTSILNGFLNADGESNHQRRISNLYIEQTFFSQYKLQAVPKLQKESDKCMMHCFSVAPRSDPLLVESILCFYLLHCSSIDDMFSRVEETMTAAYGHCFKNYPGCLFTFLGAFLTEITPENEDSKLKRKAEGAMNSVSEKVCNNGTHEIIKDHNPFQLIIKELGHEEYQQIVIWKFALRQIFKSPITPAFCLDVSLADQEYHDGHVYIL